MEVVYLKLTLHNFENVETRIFSKKAPKGVKIGLYFILNNKFSNF